MIYRNSTDLDLSFYLGAQLHQVKAGQLVEIEDRYHWVIVSRGYPLTPLSLDGASEEETTIALTALAIEADPEVLLAENPEAFPETTAKRAPSGIPRGKAPKGARKAN